MSVTGLEGVSSVLMISVQYTGRAYVRIYIDLFCLLCKRLCPVVGESQVSYILMEMGCAQMLFSFYYCF